MLLRCCCNDGVCGGSGWMKLPVESRRGRWSRVEESGRLGEGMVLLFLTEGFRVCCGFGRWITDRGCFGCCRTGGGEAGRRGEMGFSVW